MPKDKSNQKLKEEIQEIKTIQKNGIETKIETAEKLDEESILEVFVDAQGETKELNPVLKKDENKNLTTTATPYQLSLPQNAAQETKIAIKDIAYNLLAGKSEDKDSIQKALTEAEEISLSITATAANQANVKNVENKALYQDVFENIDLLVTSEDRGIKEDLILKKEPTQVNSIYQGNGLWEIEYQLNLKGLRAEENKGGLNFYNQQGELRLEIPKPYMIDANGKRSDEANYQIIESNESQTETVKIKLMANTTGLTYPIDLDPTVYVASLIDDDARFLAIGQPDFKTN